MTEITGRFLELQEEEFDTNSPDSEISRIRMIELMNFVDRESYHIGDVVESFLTYDEFREAMDKTWTVCMGQNISQSDLGQMLSLNNLPPLSSKTGMLLQANLESELGDYSQGYNVAHAHGITKGSASSGSYDGASDVNGGSSITPISSISHTMPDGYDYDTASTTIFYTKEAINSNPDPSYGLTSEHGTTFRPKSYGGNYFIKVNVSGEWSDD